MLRLLPRMLVASSMVPFLMAMLARLFFSAGSPENIERNIQTFDFVMVGLVIFAWTAALTLAIACFIVWIMKGPAYVADAYLVSDSDKPKNECPRRFK